MNRKQLIILLALVAVLGGAGLVLMNRNHESWSAGADSKQGRKLLENFQMNDVAQIRLVGESELNLIRTNDLWRVQERANYPANFSQISGFLIKLSDLKITLSEPIEPSQIADLKLVEPKPGQKPDGKTATMIELKDAAGKTLRTILLGIKHTHSVSGGSYGGDNEMPDGRYLMLKEDPKNALLINDELGSSDPQPDQWLNKDFFKIEKIKSITYTAPEPTNSWKLASTNEGSPLTLADCATNETPDASKISSLCASLNTPSFMDVATNTATEITGLDKPQVLQVETFDHFSYTIKIGKKTADDNHYLTVAIDAQLPKERVASPNDKPEDKAKLDNEFSEQIKHSATKLAAEKKLDSWTFIASRFWVESLARSRAQLMQEKPETKPATSGGGDMPPHSLVPNNLDIQDISTAPALPDK